MLSIEKDYQYYPQPTFFEAAIRKFHFEQDHSLLDKFCQQLNKICPHSIVDKFYKELRDDFNAQGILFTSSEAEWCVQYIRPFFIMMSDEEDLEAERLTVQGNQRKL
jgi:hypothetical protein